MSSPAPPEAPTKTFTGLRAGFLCSKREGGKVYQATPVGASTQAVDVLSLPQDLQRLHKGSIFADLCKQFPGAQTFPERYNLHESSEEEETETNRDLKAELSTMDQSHSSNLSPEQKAEMPPTHEIMDQNQGKKTPAPEKKSVEKKASSQPRNLKKTPGDKEERKGGKVPEQPKHDLATLSSLLMFDGCMQGQCTPCDRAHRTLTILIQLLAQKDPVLMNHLITCLKDQATVGTVLSRQMPEGEQVLPGPQSKGKPKKKGKKGQTPKKKGPSSSKSKSKPRKTQQNEPSRDSRKKPDPQSTPKQQSDYLTRLLPNTAYKKGNKLKLWWSFVRKNVTTSTLAYGVHSGYIKILKLVCEGSCTFEVTGDFISHVTGSQEVAELETAVAVAITADKARRKEKRAGMEEEQVNRE